MHLVLALGNPGAAYRDTRHNAGWWLADRLVARWGFGGFSTVGETAWTSGVVGGHDVEVHKPLTYMNRSGRVVEQLRRGRGFDPASEMLVLVDDIWLPPGRIRVRRSGSPGGHNGLKSIAEAIGSDYARLRIGVGRPADDRIDLAAWVLARMSRADEEATVATLKRAADAVEVWVDLGVEAVMSRFNST